MDEYVKMVKPDGVIVEVPKDKVKHYKDKGWIKEGEMDIESYKKKMKENLTFKRKMKRMKRKVNIKDDSEYLKYGRILKTSVTNSLISFHPQAIDKATSILWGKSIYPHYQEGDDYRLRGNVIVDNGAGKLDGIANMLEREFIPLTIIKTDRYVVGIILGESMTQKEFNKLIKPSKEVKIRIKHLKNLSYLIELIALDNNMEREYKSFVNKQIPSKKIKEYKIADRSLGKYMETKVKDIKHLLSNEWELEDDDELIIEILASGEDYTQKEIQKIDKGLAIAFNIGTEFFES